MKKIIIALLLTLLALPVFAAKIPVKFQGEWNLLMISKDMGRTYTQTTATIGTMKDAYMWSQGSKQVLDSISYDETKDILTIAFKYSPTIWVVYNMRSRMVIHVYRAENGETKYLFTMLAEIKP